MSSFVHLSITTRLVFARVMWFKYLSNSFDVSTRTEKTGLGVTLRNFQPLGASAPMIHMNITGGGLKYFLIFTPLFKEDDPIWLIFLRWVVQPPTSNNLAGPLWQCLRQGWLQHTPTHDSRHMVPMMCTSPGVTFGRYEDSGPTEYAGGQRFSAGLGELQQQLVVSKGSMLLLANPPGLYPKPLEKTP